MKKILLTLPLLSAAALPAQVLLNETFSYADGNITNVSAGAWVTHSGSGPLNVSGGAAIINQGDLTTGLADVNRGLSTTFNASTDNSSKIYGAFTISYSALPVAGDSDGSYFAHLKSSVANQFYARIGSTTNGAAPGAFRLSVANESWNVANTVEFGQDLFLNTIYQVVFRYDLATDQTTLWVNPTDELSLSVTATDAAAYVGGELINSYGLRQGTSGTGAPGVLGVDNLILGQSFADVTAVPEPSTYGIIGQGLAAFFVARR